MSQSTQKLWTKSFILALIANFMLNMSYHMLNSTIGLYAKGFTNVEFLIGLSASAFTGAALVTKLGAGKILEKFPIKKVVLFCLFFSIISSAAYFFAHNIYAVIIVRVIHGLSFGFVAVGMSTIVSMSLPRTRLLEGIGYNMMLTTLTTAFGPGLVLTITNSQPDLFQYAFLALIIVLSIAFFTILPVQPTQSNDTNINCVGRLNVTWATWFIAIMATLVAAAQSGVVVYINLYALEKGFGNMTPYFFLFAISNFSTRITMKKINEYVTERQLLYFTGFGAIIVMIGFFLATTPYVIFALGILFGISMGFFYPIVSTKILRSLSWRKQGLANSINSATGDLANMAGVTLWSVLATHTGSYAYIYPAAAVLLMIYLIILTVYPSVLKRMNIPEESEC